MTLDHDADAEATSYRIHNHSDKDNDNHDETRSCTAIPHAIITTTTTTTTSDCMRANQNNLSSLVPLTTTTIATATSTKTVVLDTTAQQQDAVDVVMDTDVVMMVVVIGLPDRDRHHIIDNDENDAIIAHMIPSTMHSLSDPCLQQQQHLHEPNLITLTNIPESKLMAELSSVSLSSTSTSSTSISSSSSSSLSMVMDMQEEQPSASSSSLSSAAISVDQDGYVHAVVLPVGHHTVQQQAQDRKGNCHNHVGTRSDERDEYGDSAVADVDPELTASQDSMHHHESLIRKIDPDSPAASSSNNMPTTTAATTTTTTTATNTIINSTRKDLELLLELPSATTNKPYVRRVRSYSDGLKAVLGASWGNFDDADYIDGNQKNVDGTQQSTNTGMPVVRSCLRSSSTKDVWFNSSALQQQQPNRHRPCGQRRKESKDNFAVAAWKRARRRRQQQYLLKQERLRQQKQQQLMKQQQSNTRPRWLIPAEHPFKLLWDILTVLLSFVNAYATHMAIRDRNFGWNNVLIRVCECWFVIDILLNFVTEHKISNGMVLNRCQAVWARYLTSWFVIDALSLIPAELLFLQPVIERQNRRGFFQKSFFRTKAVIRMTRVLRGRHLRWFQQMAKHSKRASGIGTQQLLRLIVKYVPKYYFFFHNMKGMVAVRLLRQIHWVRKLYLNVSNRRQQQQQQPEQLKKSYKEQHLNDDDDDNETLTTFTFEDEDEGHEYDDEEDDPSFNHSYDDSFDHHSLFLDDDDHNDDHDNDDRYYDLMVVDKSCAVAAAARGIAMTTTTMGGGVVTTTTTHHHHTPPIRNNHDDDDDVPF